MRKFYAVLTLAAFAALPAAAASLGTGTVINPAGNLYYVNYPTLVELEWQIEGVGQNIEFVSDNHNVTVSINGNEYPVAATLTSSAGNGDIGGLATRADEGNDALNISFYNQYEMAGSPTTGTLIVSIPQGLVCNADGEENDDQEFTFYVLQPYPESQIVITPAPNATYPPADLSEVKLSFSSPIELLDEEAKIIVSQNINDKWEDQKYLKTITAGSDYISIDLSYLAEGSYRVVIPQGVVKIGDSQINGEIWLVYNIFNGLPNATVYHGPEENSYVAYGYFIELYLTWDYTTVTANDLTANLIIMNSAGNEESIEIPATDISLATVDKPSDGPNNPDNDHPDVPVPDSRAGETGNVLIIDYQNTLPDNYSGYVTIQIPEGIVNVNGAENPSQEFSFYVYPYTTVTPTFSVENSVIEVSWAGLNLSSPNTDFFIVDGQGERTELTFDQGFGVPGQVSVNDNFTALLINLESLDLENGNYILYIPDCSVMLYDEDYNIYLCSEVNYEFEVEDNKVTGIKAVGLSETSVKGIYNLNGVKVAGNESDTYNLPAGIYIINGKKVLISK